MKSSTGTAASVMILTLPRDDNSADTRAITVLLEKVEKTKLGAAEKPRSARSIRSRTDK